MTSIPSRALPSMLLLAAAALSCASASAQVSPEGEVGLRHRGVIVNQGQQADLLASGLEIAFRLGITARAPGDLIEATLGLRSGDPAAPSTPWADFGRFGNAQPVHLDVASLSIAPAPLPELRLVAGQRRTPWSAFSLVWDEDVALPGVWLDYRPDADPDALLARLRFNLGAACLFSGDPEPADNVWLLGAALGLDLDLDGAALSLDLGAFHLFGNQRLGRASARGDLKVGARPAGFTANTTPSDADDPQAELTRRLIVDGLASEFDVLTLKAAFTLGQRDDTPLILDLQIALNLGAAGPGRDQALGLRAGLQFGRADTPGQGQIRLDGVMIGADATLDAFNPDLLGTNILGVGLSSALCAFEGLTLGFESLLSAQLDPDLRGLGDARGEPSPGAPDALQLLVTTRYVF